MPQQSLLSRRLVEAAVLQGQFNAIQGQNACWLEFCWEDAYYWAMSRLARVDVPGFPHHVTQRGNRRADMFEEDAN